MLIESYETLYPYVLQADYKFHQECSTTLARRFSSRYFLRPFGFGTPEEVREFRGILVAIQDGPPIPSISLSQSETAMRFYYATYGLIDFIGKIFDGAVISSVCIRKVYSVSYF